MTNSSFEKNIGIIGLGVLGSAIAENFINKNISIKGFDINKKVFDASFWILISSVFYIPILYFFIILFTPY